MDSGIPRGAAFFIWLCAKYSALSGLVLRCIASFPGRCPGLVYFAPFGALPCYNILPKRRRHPMDAFCTICNDGAYYLVIAAITSGSFAGVSWSK